MLCPAAPRRSWTLRFPAAESRSPSLPERPEAAALEPHQSLQQVPGRGSHSLHRTAG